MGNQQSVKSEPKPIPNLSTLGAVPSSIRSSRSKPRVPKDPRTLGSNIFTEHNGEFPPLFVLISFVQVSTGHKKECESEEQNWEERKKERKKKIFFLCTTSNRYASFFSFFLVSTAAAAAITK